MGILNGRMSERSFKAWSKRPAMIRPMMDSFDMVCAQSEEDAKRFEALGAKNVSTEGNLKFDAAFLPCDEAELVALKNTIGNRPVWLAASTHPGEETIIAQAHQLLAATRPNLLTIIVPRHPERGGDIAGELAKDGSTALRSQGQPIAPGTAFYVADTLGDLGLFYRLSNIVFMGGSLVAHGGQNPLEAARLACAILTGPHTANFSAIYEGLEKAGGCQRIANAGQLAAQTGRLLSAPAQADLMQSAARAWVDSQGGATERVIALLEPLLQPPSVKTP
jgi:3-deoxy-D-manno-octulosonic-acid transferase